MRVQVTLEVSRGDRKALRGARADEVFEALEQELGNVALEDFTINEGKSNEESVSLDVSVELVERLD